MASMPEMSVAVESTIHDAIRAVLQVIHDRQGIVVESIRVSWLDVSVHGHRPRSEVTQISIDSHQSFSDVPMPVDGETR